MDYHPLRIIFLGTPEFAVASLDALTKAGFNIVAVVTAPDKPAGRGMKLQQSAVKEYAIAHNLNVLQPIKLKDEQFIQELRSLKADLQVVVAFRMLPEVVWNMPPLGTINLHASLLPKYRGAAPINWAIINGEIETGVTTFKLKHEIDTGNILMQQSISIKDDETAGELHDRMKIIGADLLVKTVQGLANGSLKEIDQESVIGNQSPELKHAPKIYKDMCKIDWNKTVEEVYNHIRGLSPYPAAFTFLHDKILKILRCERINVSPEVPAGEYVTDGKTFLNFACNIGYIAVKELQLEGKKKMAVEEFLKGFRQHG